MLKTISELMGDIEYSNLNGTENNFIEQLTSPVSQTIIVEESATQKSVQNLEEIIEETLESESNFAEQFRDIILQTFPRYEIFIQKSAKSLEEIIEEIIGLGKKFIKQTREFIKETFKLGTPKVHRLIQGLSEIIEKTISLDNNFGEEFTDSNFKAFRMAELPIQTSEQNISYMPEGSRENNSSFSLGGRYEQNSGYSSGFNTWTPDSGVDKMYVDENSFYNSRIKSNHLSRTDLTWISVSTINLRTKSLKGVVKGVKEYKPRNMLDEVAVIKTKELVGDAISYWLYRSNERFVKDAFRAQINPMHKPYKFVSPIYSFYYYYPA